MVGLDAQAVGGMGMFAWLVPGVALTLPALLFMLVVLAQTVLAGVFVPVTRRVFGAARPKGRRRAPASSR
jgi:hypothetical protein